MENRFCVIFYSVLENNCNSFYQQNKGGIYHILWNSGNGRPTSNNEKENYNSFPENLASLISSFN